MPLTNDARFAACQSRVTLNVSIKSVFQPILVTSNSNAWTSLVHEHTVSVMVITSSAYAITPNTQTNYIQYYTIYNSLDCTGRFIISDKYIVSKATFAVCYLLYRDSYALQILHRASLVGQD